MLLPFLRRLPTRQGIGQVDADALRRIAAIGQWRAKRFEIQAELKMGDDERRGQDLEPENTLHGRFLQIMGYEGIAALVP